MTLGRARQWFLELARLFPGVLLAPTANHVISAGEHEITKTRTRDRAGSSNASAARRVNGKAEHGKSGRCGQGEERRREESP